MDWLSWPVMSRSLVTLLAGWMMVQVQAASVFLQPSLNPPAGTSLVVDPSFAGFGIEPSNLFSFMGYASPNQLTVNLLENLVNYTGYPGHVRIGGNTQDYMVYSDAQLEWTWINNPGVHSGKMLATDSMLIGPRFYDAIDRLPAGTPVTYGLNMAYDDDDYIQVITTLATQALQRLRRVQIVSFEIGNEPDLWLQNGFRSGQWGGQKYVQQWTDRANVLCHQVLEPRGLPCDCFEPAATANTINTDFQINDLVRFGVTEQVADRNLSFVARWNQHDYYYFVGVSSYPLTLEHLLTFFTTRQQFAAWEEQVAQADATPYRYALREMGMVGPAGIEGITDTFGAALWALNFFLYAATLNISHVGMHMTDNSNASAWQPLEMYGRQPFVRPLYYAFAAFNQIIGPSCQARVQSHREVTLPADYQGRVEVYSIFQANELAGVVVINGQLANASGQSIPSLTVNLSLPMQLANQELHIAYLTNKGADATSGTTWNGLSFEANGDGLPSAVDDSGRTVVVGNDGGVLLTVRDSEALVAQLGVPVGQVQANSSACDELMQVTRTSASASHSSTDAAMSIQGLRVGGGPAAGIGLALLTLMTSCFLGGATLMAW